MDVYSLTRKQRPAHLTRASPSKSTMAVPSTLPPQEPHSQLPPEYRQALLLQQQQQQQQLKNPHQPSRQNLGTKRPSVSLSSSPIRPANKHHGHPATPHGSSRGPSSHQRIVSAPILSTRLLGKNHDPSAISPSPSRAHWKPDSSAAVCTRPGCLREFGFFERRHHCRRCGDIFCSVHCSKSIPLDQALDFNPAMGTVSRACVGCFEVYEQWQGISPSPAFSTSSTFNYSGQSANRGAFGSLLESAMGNGYSLPSNTLSESMPKSSAMPGLKKNMGRIPDGLLGDGVLGREDIVRRPVVPTNTIAIKARMTDNDIDGQVLLSELDHGVLKDELGIKSFGQRCKVLNQVWQLRGSTMTDSHVKEELVVSPATNSGSASTLATESPLLGGIMRLRGLNLVEEPGVKDESIKREAISKETDVSVTIISDDEQEPIPMLAQPLVVMRTEGGFVVTRAESTSAKETRAKGDDSESDGEDLDEEDSEEGGDDSESEDAFESADDTLHTGLVEEEPGMISSNSASISQRAVKASGGVPVNGQPSRAQDSISKRIAPTLVSLPAPTGISSLPTTPGSSATAPKRLAPTLISTSLTTRDAQQDPTMTFSSSSGSGRPSAEDSVAVWPAGEGDPNTVDEMSSLSLDSPDLNKENKQRSAKGKVVQRSRSTVRNITYLAHVGASLRDIFFHKDGSVVESESEPEDWAIIARKVRGSKRAPHPGYRKVVQKQMQRLLRDPPIFDVPGSTVYAPLRRIDRDVPVKVFARSGASITSHMSTWDNTFKDDAKGKNTLRVAVTVDTQDMASIDFSAMTKGAQRGKDTRKVSPAVEDFEYPLYGDSDASAYTTDEELYREVAKEEKESTTQAEKKRRRAPTKAFMTQNAVRAQVDQYQLDREARWNEVEEPRLERNRLKIYKQLLHPGTTKSAVMGFLDAEITKVSQERMKTLVQAMIETSYKNQSEVNRACKALDETVDHLCDYRWKLSLVSGSQPSPPPKQEADADSRPSKEKRSNSICTARPVEESESDLDDFIDDSGMEVYPHSDGRDDDGDIEMEQDEDDQPHTKLSSKKLIGSANGDEAKDSSAVNFANEKRKKNKDSKKVIKARKRKDDGSPVKDNHVQVRRDSDAQVPILIVEDDDEEMTSAQEDRREPSPEVSVPHKTDSSSTSPALPRRGSNKGQKRDASDEESAPSENVPFRKKERIEPEVMPVPEPASMAIDGPVAPIREMASPNWRNIFTDDDYIIAQLKLRRQHDIRNKTILKEPWLSVYQEYVEWISLDVSDSISIRTFLKWKSNNHTTKEYRKQAAIIAEAERVAEIQEKEERTAAKARAKEEAERLQEEHKAAEAQKNRDLEAEKEQAEVKRKKEASEKEAFDEKERLLKENQSVPRLGRRRKTIRIDISDEEDEDSSLPPSPASASATKDFSKAAAASKGKSRAMDLEDDVLVEDTWALDSKRRKRILHSQFGIGAQSSEESGHEEEPLPRNTKSKSRTKVRQAVHEAEDVLQLRKNAAMNEEAVQKRIREQARRGQSRAFISTLDEGEVEINPGHKKTERSVAIPPFLASQLKPHQIAGVQFMWKNLVMLDAGCILAHSMGLGKTFQVVTLIFVLLRELQAGNKDIPKTLQAGRVLLLVPPTVIDNWGEEFEKWIPEEEQEVIKLRKLMGSKEYKTTAQRISLLEEWHENGGVLLMSYQLFRELSIPSRSSMSDDQMMRLRSALISPGPSLVFADEGHLIKNKGAKLSQAVKLIKSPARVILTGYPLQNRLEEYWCMVDFVRPNYLGDPSSFQLNYIFPIANGLYPDSTMMEKKISSKKLKVLIELISSFVMRKDQAVLRASLPKKVEFVIACKLTEIQRFVYLDFLNTLDQTNSLAAVLPNVLVVTTICNHPAIFKAVRKSVLDTETGTDTDLKTANPDMSLVPTPAALQPLMATKGEDISTAISLDSEEEEDPQGAEIAIRALISDAWSENSVLQGDIRDESFSNKLKIMIDIVKECQAIGEKVLVFSRSIRTVEFIQYTFERLLPRKGVHIRAMMMDGRTPVGERQSRIHQFNSSDYDVFIISTGSGSQGINLVSASRVIIFDVGWTPSFDEQAIARAFRYGQTRKVFVYRLQTFGTMEDKLYKTNLHKLGLASRVVDKKNTVNAFSKTEMKKYFEPPPKEVPRWATDDNVEQLFQKPDMDDSVLRAVIEQNRESLALIVPQRELIKEEVSDLTEADMLEIQNMVHEERQRILAHGQIQALPPRAGAPSFSAVNSSLTMTSAALHPGQGSSNIQVHRGGHLSHALQRNASQATTAVSGQGNANIKRHIVTMPILTGDNNALFGNPASSAAFSRSNVPGPGQWQGPYPGSINANMTYSSPLTLNYGPYGAAGPPPPGYRPPSSQLQGALYPFIQHSQAGPSTGTFGHNSSGSSSNSSGGSSNSTSLSGLEMTDAKHQAILDSIRKVAGPQTRPTYRPDQK